MNEIIPAGLDGERTDRVVASITGMTRAAVAQAVAAGLVKVDDKVVTTRSQPVAEGQKIEMELPSLEAQIPQPQSGINFKVVYEDEHLLVINKPVGLVVHPGAGNPDRTLVNGLLNRYPDIAKTRPGQPERPGIVHRLDAGTTGLLVVSRNQAVHEQLVELLKARSIKRTYLALVWGHIATDSGVIDAPIGRGARHRTKMAVSVQGKEARTSYVVLGKSSEPETTLVRAELETGRTHQIRVHFGAIGHALVGDRRYNGLRDTVKLSRPYLHAVGLAFCHPVTGEELAFWADVPEDLTQVADTLGLGTQLTAARGAEVPSS